MLHQRHNAQVRCILIGRVSALTGNLVGRVEHFVRPLRDHLCCRARCSRSLFRPEIPSVGQQTDRVRSQIAYIFKMYHECRKDFGSPLVSLPPARSSPVPPPRLYLRVRNVRRFVERSDFRTYSLSSSRACRYAADNLRIRVSAKIHFSAERSVLHVRFELTFDRGARGDRDARFASRARVFH